MSRKRFMWLSFQIKTTAETKSFEDVAQAKLARSREAGSKPSGSAASRRTSR